jgi:beta-lactamase superfamily II metal-dependent hydrolase
MVLSASDSLIIFLLAFGLMGAVFYFDAMTGNSVGFNSSLGSGSHVDLCDAVNCTMLLSDLDRIVVVTTTTLPKSRNFVNISVFNVSGRIAAVVSSGGENILIDCGSSNSVMDRLFFSGLTNITSAVITNLDYEHAGGCSRTFMMIPPGSVYDSGVYSNLSWYSDYVFIVSKRRMSVLDSVSIMHNRVVGVINRVNSSLVPVFSYGNLSVSFVGDCGSNPRFLNSSVVFCDGVVGEDEIRLYKPKIVVSGVSDGKFVAMGKKYGTAVISSSEFSQLNVLLEGSKVTYKTKK